MAMSPFVMSGGIINALNPPVHDNWIGYLTNIVFAVIFGIIILGCGVGLGLSTGLAASVAAVSQKPQPPADSK